jgi:hypothetical protein
MLKIKVVYDIDVDIEEWARVSNITIDEATADVLAFFGRMDPAAGQTYATLVRASAIEDL